MSNQQKCTDKEPNNESSTESENDDCDQELKVSFFFYSGIFDLGDTCFLSIFS